tara:strand:- start:36005 stop:36526 length:522 start_codon:yes stop_codon:yes gene_type:complete
MIFYMPFLIGTGALPEADMSSGCIALSAFWGGDYKKLSVDEQPSKFLSSFSNEDSLYQLNGDAAKFDSIYGSWLEALAAWRKSIVLMVLPSNRGEIPGNAYAYVSLCRDLSVPLIGIVQLGGDWDSRNRKLDGLPWCGWLPIDELKKTGNSIIPMDTIVVCENIKRKMKDLNL